MKAKEIIKLGISLGLPFRKETNYPFQLEKNYVVFDGINGQRFSVDGKDSKEQILKNFGDALIAYGSKQLEMEIKRLLNIS